mgnify:FL=1
MLNAHPSQRIGQETGRFKSLLAGLAVVVLLTFLAFELARVPGFKLLGPLVLALLGGAGWRLASGTRTATVAPGARFAATFLLRLGIVLLGVRLDMRALAAVGPTVLVGSALGVLVAFGAVEAIGRRWGVPRDLRRSIAVGTGVCGASAIAAALPLLKPDEKHVSLSVAVVSVLGTLGVVAFAAWDGLALVSSKLVAVIAGATLQEVGHVVAAGAAVGGGEGDLALLVKLSRVVLLAPVLMLLGWWLRREAVRDGARATEVPGAAATGTKQRLPPLVPGFVLGFLALSGVTSLGWLSADAVTYLTLGGTLLTAAAMVGIGLGVQFRGLGRAGRQAISLGVVGFFAMLIVMSSYYALTLG